MEVLPVPEGSIIWMHNVGPFTAEDSEDALMALRLAIGHKRFAILTTEGSGSVEVVGPDDLVGRVRAALAEET